MATTYQAIATVEVGAGTASSIDFSNIPQTYTDLLLVLSARGTNSGYRIHSTRLTFNGTTSGYTTLSLSYDGLNLNSGTNPYGVTSASVTFYNSNAGLTANTFGNSYLYIPNYTSSNNKSFSVDSVAENNATGIYNIAMLLNAGLLSNTAAITSIKLEPQGDEGNYAQYSTATLYGIKNS